MLVVIPYCLAIVLLLFNSFISLTCFVSRRLCIRCGWRAYNCSISLVFDFAYTMIVISRITLDRHHQVRSGYRKVCFAIGHRYYWIRELLHFIIFLQCKFVSFLGSKRYFCVSTLLWCIWNKFYRLPLLFHCFPFLRLISSILCFVFTFCYAVETEVSCENTSAKLRR